MQIAFFVHVVQKAPPPKLLNMFRAGDIRVIDPSGCDATRSE